MTDRAVPICGSLLASLLLLCLLACGDTAPEPRPEADAVATAVFDGPAAKHAQEMVTAAVLFAGPIANRATRLEAIALEQGRLIAADQADLLAAEMRGASLELPGIDGARVASFRCAEGERPDWLLVSIGSDEARYRLVITPARDHEAGPAGPGSSALDLTVFLECLRLMTLARAAAPIACERFAYDFVLPLTDRSGHEFLVGMPRRPGVIVGCLSVEGLAATDPAARVLVARISRPGSVIAQAATSVLRDFGSTAAGWGEVGVDPSLEPAPKALLDALGQADLPLLQLAGARGREGTSFVPPLGLDRKFSRRSLPPLAAKFGGAEDRVAELGGTGYPLALAAARALAIVLLRCEAAYAGR